MRVAVYASPFSSNGKPTGVGRHIACMSSELVQAEGVDPVLLAHRRSYAQARPGLTNGLGEAPVRFLPGPERWSRALLLSTNLTGIERWAGDVDWVYCPKEQPVATRDARLAVTIHDVLPLEPSVRGLPAASFRSRLRWRLLMDRVLSRAHLIATVSEFTRQRILELFDKADPRRIHVIGNGVSPPYFEPASDADDAVLDAFGVTRGRYAVTVGSLTRRKSGDTLLRLAERLQDDGAHFDILVTGRRHEPDLVAEWRRLREKRPGLPLHLAGYVPDERLAALLRHCRAMLFPSRYEGFGIPVLEAMGAGAPVITSRASSLPETAGGAAELVDPDDDAAMAAALDRLDGDRAHRDRLIVAGRDRAAEFTWERCGQRLVQALAERG
jgi:alpha-1,3-rhamnosyl/mannosyltransferase